jgi:membrane-bound serine protease (ClpP class)
VFITVAANIAAMAPGTNIGAATPISGDGQDIPQDLRRKVMNDTIAYAKTIAEQRGRNKDWVVKAVTEAASITEQEALRNKVIDIVASSPQELLVAINGRTVKVAGGKTLTLRTKDTPFQEIPKNWRESLLMFLAHPNVFYILMLLAIYGILGELQNPGRDLPWRDWRDCAAARAVCGVGAARERAGRRADSAGVRAVRGGAVHHLAWGADGGRAGLVHHRLDYPVPV